jgi:hypothetical protein
MKKQLLYILLPLLFLTLTAFTVHKYYMALFQINFAPEKEMLQITGRIHIDDLNKALEKKHKKKVAVENEKNSDEELKALNEYLSSHFSIKVNEQLKPMNFLSKEIDGDELICYWNIKGISKINSLEIYNTILIDRFPEQQNMINITVLGLKNSFLLTNSTHTKVLKY